MDPGATRDDAVSYIPFKLPAGFAVGQDGRAQVGGSGLKLGQDFLRHLVPQPGSFCARYRQALSQVRQGELGDVGPGKLPARR